MRLRTLLITALLVAGFLYVTTKSDSPLRRAFAPDNSPLWNNSNTAHSAGLGADEQNTIDIYKNAHDSVVYVTSTVVERNWLFEQVGKALGSGFIVNPGGEILTNNHVVSGSRQLEVTLPDQTRYNARILARDATNDLALIKIEPKHSLRALQMGDSDRLQVGQKVLAIGQPLGLDGTLTTGIVSSLGRTIDGENNRELEGMIQTDAAINQGNSGGPLLDSAGEVIGINTAIYTPSGGSIGIGFAMPINRAKSMLEAIRTGKGIAQPAGPIGIQTMYVSGDYAEALRLPSGGGILVQEVRRGSPAAEAGLHGGIRDVVLGGTEITTGGDLITAVEGKPVNARDALVRAISRKHAGETLGLTVLRDGRTMDIKVTLSEALDSRF
ncbi:MAG TPA: trypsin-like peptidase domain-containing protein [Bryobacteraceae bacterium]